MIVVVERGRDRLHLIVGFIGGKCAFDVVHDGVSVLVRSDLQGIIGIEIGGRNPLDLVVDLTVLFSILDRRTVDRHTIRVKGVLIGDLVVMPDRGLGQAKERRADRSREKATS